MWAGLNDIPGSFRNICFGLISESQLLLLQVQRLIGEGAKVGDRRGDDAIPLMRLMIQVSY